jgi:predicted adenylyl cyclase CyaB
MREIEIKILDISRKETEDKLTGLGAKKIFDDEVHAVYYDFSDNSLGNEKATFRLRREGKRSVLTFKTHVEDSEAKVRDEIEVAVGDFMKMRSLLEAVGFRAWLEMKKHRVTYELPGVHFEFDKYHGMYEYIPEFLEIEGADIETVRNYAGMLGFRKEDCKPWDALQVAEYYSNRTTAE